MNQYLNTFIEKYIDNNTPAPSLAVFNLIEACKGVAITFESGYELNHVEWKTVAVKGGSAVIAYPNIQKGVNIKNPWNGGKAKDVHPILAGVIFSVISCSHGSNSCFGSDNQLSALLSKNYSEVRSHFLNLVEAALYPHEAVNTLGDDAVKMIGMFSDMSKHEKEAIDEAATTFYHITQ